MKKTQVCVVEQEGKQWLEVRTADACLKCPKFTLQSQRYGELVVKAAGHKVCIKGDAFQASAEQLNLRCGCLLLKGYVKLHTDGPGSCGKESRNVWTRDADTGVRVDLNSKEENIKTVNFPQP